MILVSGMFWGGGVAGGSAEVSASRRILCGFSSRVRSVHWPVLYPEEEPQRRAKCAPRCATRYPATQIQLSGSPSGGYTLAYNYYLPGTTPTGCPVAASGSGDNGSVIGYTYTDNVNNYAESHSGLYVYDTLNRLVCAQATSPNNNPAATYDLVFSYDRYGNMACSQNASTNGPCPQWAYNAGTNQLSTSTGCAYDAAGNLTTDCSISPTHAYTWDAEGRVASVDPGTSPTWSFTYNALGDRAQWAYGSSGAGPTSTGLTRRGIGWAMRANIARSVLATGFCRCTWAARRSSTT